MTVVNTGSVSLSYDGDARASYLLLDGSNATIRRVSYDIEAEVRAIMQCGACLMRGGSAKRCVPRPIFHRHRGC
jgi:hypothetical protein